MTARERALRSAAIFCICILCNLPAAHAICGEKGGPGYRDGNGKCVGWDNFKSACGVPPETRCKAEAVNTRPEEAKGDKKKP